MADSVAMSPDLLRLIVCPRCKAKLGTVQGTVAVALRCTGCGYTYPIIDGIPILLLDRASKEESGAT